MAKEKRIAPGAPVTVELPQLDFQIFLDRAVVLLLICGGMIVCLDIPMEIITHVTSRVWGQGSYAIKAYLRMTIKWTYILVECIQHQRLELVQGVIDSLSPSPFYDRLLYLKAIQETS